MKKSIIFLLKLLHKPYLKIIRNTQISTTSRICSGVYVSNCIIGKYCYIGLNSYLNSVVMGNYCSVAGYVVVGAMEHPYNSGSTSSHLFPDKCIMGEKTSIGNDVWIGTQVVIRQGITIGDGAVIGANSFVNKDVPSYAIVIGSPAHILKYRFSKEKQNALIHSHFYDYSPKDAREIINNIINE